MPILTKLASVATLIGTVAAVTFTGSAAYAAGTTYAISTSSGANMLSGVSDTGNHCDDCTTTLNSPFPLRAYGQQYSSFKASSNGNIQFTTNSAAYSNTALPTASLGTMVAPYWDDMRTDGAGNGIFTAVYGAAPFRQYVVEWRVVQYSTGEYANFEVILNEANDQVVTRYGSTGDGGNSTTIGIQNGSVASTYAHNQARSVFNGLQVNYLASSTGTSTTYQEDAASYTKVWRTSNCVCFLGGHTYKTNALGARATFAFTGSGIQWITAIGPSRGTAKVLLDGVLVKRTNNYAASNHNRVVGYIKTFAGTGTHTIRIVNAATPGHSRTDIDAFIVAE